METFYDGLIFDDRTTDHLFGNKHSTQLLYADVLKRWAAGYRLTEREQRTVAQILISYPEYVMEHDKTENSVQLISQLLQLPELQITDNIEKGLWLYRLLYFLIITKTTEKWIPVINELKNVFIQYETLGHTILEDLNYYRLTVQISSGTFGTANKKEKFAKAYINMISQILDLKEMLLPEPYFDLNEFPMPGMKLSDADLRQIRLSALKEYQNNSYDRADDMYKIIRIARFELSGTFIHLVRIQLSLGNLSKSELYVAMAWRYRATAEDYVLGRILFMIIFLHILQSKPIIVWLAGLKYALSLKPNNFFPIEWEMEEVIDRYQTSLKPRMTNLLRRILGVLSHDCDFQKLNEMSLWKKLEPIPKEQWPDYTIT